MEKYEVENHLFYDGYKLNSKLLKNHNYIKNLLNIVNKEVFNNKGRIKLIPYFDGKIKRDGGISGIIIGNNYHFTCHTFCFKNTVFIDYFGDDNKKEKVKEIIFKTFITDDYDMGSKDIPGNFGKHVIFKSKLLTLEESIDLIKKVLKDIDMTPITKLLINNKDKTHFDIIQPIAESHISFHRNNDEMIIDVFSCKYFDVNKLLKLFNVTNDYIEVNRGIKYK